MTKLSLEALTRTQPGFFLTLALTGVLIATPSAWAAGMKTLPGHVPAAVTRLTAKGGVPTTNQMALVIGLPLRDPQGLDAFLASVSDPASPNYRQYLTPKEFTERFGPTEADYAAVAAFARANHFTITAQHSNRLLLDVKGSVEDIQQAFHLNLKAYRHPTENRDFFAPDTEPTVDAALPVADISGLNNFVLPRPKSLRMDTTPAASASPRTGSGSSGAFIGNDFRTAYLPGVTLTGAGQIVGVLEFDGYYASDITAYETTAGYPQVPVQTVLLDGYDGTPTTGSKSGNPEVSLDIELAIALAPGLSKVVSFEAGPNGFNNDILSAMASSNQIKQFSCSWGWGGGPTATTDNIFKQMASQGQSFFSASGDSDAFTTGATSANGVDNTSLANAPSSCPYITAVGGTTLNTTGPGGAWSSEAAWNWGLDNGNYVGGSGGVSSYYAIPTWQTGISMTSNGGSTAYRNSPDVAMTADNVYVKYGNGSAAAYGGTSCAAPLWTAMAALMNQQAVALGVSTVGFINPALYAIAKGPAYTSTFHDITSGNNVSSSSPNEFYAVAGYDLCTGWGTPIGESLINAMVAAPDSLGITPSAGFTAVGGLGGPFTPNSQTLVLSNSSSAPLAWALLNGSAWLVAAPAAGVIAPQSTASVAVSLSPFAAGLGAGIYTTNLTFSNLTTQASQTKSYNLQIGQSIVQNGGFETGDFTGWTLVGQTVVNNSRHGPTVYDAVEGSAAGYTVVHSGLYGAFLGDDAAATLSQTLATTPGQNYALSFWLNNTTAGSVQQFSVSWNGATLASLSSPAAFAWTNYQFVVSASPASSVLQFKAENDPSYFGLDDVSVTPIPAVAFQTATKTPTSFSLTWSAASDVSYQVQYKTNLLQPTWLNLGAPIVASGNSLTLNDTNANSSSPQRFYRMVLSP